MEEEVEIENDITEDVTNDNEIGKKQNNFLSNIIGKTVNTAIDIGLRTVLPNVVEDQVIDVKNTIINSGFKEGMKNLVDSAINLGKSATGIFTGKFENISQAYTAIKSGGIVDSISKLIDNSVKSAQKNGLINKTTATLLKKGKKVIKESVSSNIEETFLNQVDGIEKIGKYINNWNTYLNTKDQEGMEKEYKKIQEKLDEVMPLKTTLNEINAIENIRTLMKNKGGIENITSEEIELAKKFATS